MEAQRLLFAVIWNLSTECSSTSKWHPVRRFTSSHRLPPTLKMCHSLIFGKVCCIYFHNLPFNRRPPWGSGRLHYRHQYGFLSSALSGYLAGMCGSSIILQW